MSLPFKTNFPIQNVEYSMENYAEKDRIVARITTAIEKRYLIPVRTHMMKYYSGEYVVACLNGKDAPFCIYANPISSEWPYLLGRMMDSPTIGDLLFFVQVIRYLRDPLSNRINEPLSKEYLDLLHKLEDGGLDQLC